MPDAGSLDLIELAQNPADQYQAEDPSNPIQDDARIVAGHLVEWRPAVKSSEPPIADRAWHQAQYM